VYGKIEQGSVGCELLLTTRGEWLTDGVSIHSSLSCR